MNVRTLALTVVALAATAAASGAPERAAAAEPQPRAREEMLLVELVADMRKLLSAVVPEIALPALELKLPRLDRDAG